MVLCSNHDLWYLNVGGMPNLEKIYVIDTLDLPYIADNGSPNYIIESCQIQNSEMQFIKKSNSILFPNPTLEYVFCEIPDCDGKIYYELISLNGNTLEKGVLNENTISVNNLRTGTYILQLDSNNSMIFNRKFIKK